MKLTSAITIGLITISSLVAGANYKHTSLNEMNKGAEKIEIAAPNDDFEKAVQLIKKYEGLHQPKHWPLIGYGHRVLPGEKYSRSKALGEKEAEALLRKDLLKNCAVFRSFGADSLILGVLAYNIGSGAALRSSVARKLKSGNRDIYDSYVAHSRYRGKTNSQIKKRRIEEFETLFIKNPSEYNQQEEVVVTEDREQLAVAPRRIRNLYTPAMQYPLHMTPQLWSADSKELAARRGTKKDTQTEANYKSLTACILKPQQYYWL